jgi:hypothetical protein
MGTWRVEWHVHAKRPYLNSQLKNTKTAVMKIAMVLRMYTPRRSNMAWHLTAFTAISLASAVLLSGCNVGKTDTVTAISTTSGGGTTTTTGTTNTGKGCTGSYMATLSRLRMKCGLPTGTVS